MRWAGPRLGAVLVACSVCGGARGALAEVYKFVDSDGVVHFTNVPPGGFPKDKKRSGQAGAESKRKSPVIDDDSIESIRRYYRIEESRYDSLIDEAARYYTLPPALVKAVVAIESSFRAAAVSKAGAMGLMQLIPETARAMHVEDAFRPWDNVYGGCRYLRMLANRFGGDLRLTLAAYNSGPEAVQKYGGVPNYPETQAYVRRVLAMYRHYLRTWRVESQ